MKLIARFGLILISALAIGCSASPDKSFERHLKTAIKDTDLSEYQQGDAAKGIDDKKWRKHWNVINAETVKYNVVKTDSLTSPFAATLSFETLSPADNSMVLHESKEAAIAETRPANLQRNWKYDLSYAYQDNNWRLRAIRRSSAEENPNQDMQSLIDEISNGWSKTYAKESVIADRFKMDGLSLE
jgi:hypothetical protein